MGRTAAFIAVTATLLVVGQPARGDARISLRAPTGYQDYCAGLTRALRKRVCGSGGALRALWRPLHLPTVASGGACPVSPRRVVSGSITGSGAGPVFPTHLEPWSVSFPPPANSLAVGTGWSVDKTPLVFKKTFKGSFVVRGRRIDGAGDLGFSGPGTRRPFEAMQFAAGRSGATFAGLKGWPTLVWMAAPGCYALQIDGQTFSRVVVFSVEPA
jgi:hypothetical protein